MNKEEILKKLDDEMKKIWTEDDSLHIVACRKQAIENLGLEIVSPYTKKGYKEPENCIIFGSNVGSDSIFFIRETKKR